MGEYVEIDIIGSLIQENIYMSSHKVRFNLRRRITNHNDDIAFELNKHVKSFVDHLIEYQEIKRRNPSPYYSITLDVPYKPRSTGEGSQNHHINGHVQQLANELGWEFEDVKKYAKQRAIKYGYPIKKNTDGDAILDPWGYAQGASETELNSEQAAHLIEALHEVAAENGIILREE